MEPAQDMNQNLGKVVRLTDTGMIPSTNPYYDQGRIKAQIWSLGHRNLLGIAFDKAGNLWTHEMGPRGGDEFNLVRKGENYGWPKVSEGRHYGGTPIPAHSTDPKFIRSEEHTSELQSLMRNSYAVLCLKKKNNTKHKKTKK